MGDTINLDDLTPEEYENLTDEQRQALLEGLDQPEGDAGDGMPAGDSEPVTTEGDDADPQGDEAATPTAEAQPSADDTVPTGGKKGDLNIALQQARERERQAVARASQLEEFLKNPEAVRAYLMQQGVQLDGADTGATDGQDDELPIDDEDAALFNALIDRRVKPLESQVNSLLAENQQLKQREHVSNLSKQFPDLPDQVAAFDEMLPHLANRYQPQEKYFLLKGMEAANPQAFEAKVQAAAKQLAEKMVAEKLDSKDKETAVTLTGVKPARKNDQEYSIDDISEDQYNSLDENSRRRLLGG